MLAARLLFAGRLGGSAVSDADGRHADEQNQRPVEEVFDAAFERLGERQRKAKDAGQRLVPAGQPWLQSSSRDGTSLQLSTNAHQIVAMTGWFVDM